MFTCLHPDGDDLARGITTVVSGPAQQTPGRVLRRRAAAALEPVAFGHLMSQLAGQAVTSSPGNPPCGFLLTWETWPEDPGGEQAVAVTADIHGRAWEAARRKDTPGVTGERFWLPGTPARSALVRELLAVALWCGVTAWDKPVPFAGLPVPG